jgi:hypothetical protein
LNPLAERTCFSQVERVAGVFRSKKAAALAVWQAYASAALSQPGGEPFVPGWEVGALEGVDDAAVTGVRRRAARFAEWAEIGRPAMYDLPREDMGVCPEAWNSGANGGFLVTADRGEFGAWMDALANPRVLPLLLALLGRRARAANSSGPRGLPWDPFAPP